MFKNAIEEDNPKKFWQSFPFPLLIQLGHPLLAIYEIDRVLNDCKKIDEEAFFKYHKGNPYYWLGFSYFLLKDYQSASFYMDAAVREDINRVPVNYPSPATNFIELRGEPSDQAGKELVELAELTLNDLVNKYNQFIKSNNENQEYSVELVRKYFLTRATKPEFPKLQSLATTFISYILEHESRYSQLQLVRNPSSKEPFLLHLFKGCLLFESLLKENPRVPQITPRQTLGCALQNLYQFLDIKPDINTSTDHFQNVIDLIGRYDDSLNIAFEVTSKTRNTIGHSIGWVVDLNQNDYQQLFEIISNCCLHVIFRLYKD